MTNSKILGALATAAMVAGVAGPAAAQIASEVSTSAGFTLSADGGVTSVILSSAASNNFAFSSAVSNTGGVYTDAFATVEEDLGQTALTGPQNIELGTAITTTEGSESVSIISPAINIDLFEAITAPAPL